MFLVFFVLKLLMKSAPKAQQRRKFQSQIFQAPRPAGQRRGRPFSPGITGARKNFHPIFQIRVTVRGEKRPSPGSASFARQHFEYLPPLLPTCGHVAVLAACRPASLVSPGNTLNFSLCIKVFSLDILGIYITFHLLLLSSEFCPKNLHFRLESLL